MQVRETPSGWFQFGIAALVVAGFGYVGALLQTSPTLAAPADPGRAPLSVQADADTRLVFTSSPDGRTIYTWRVVPGSVPKYLGKSQAILEQ